MPGMNFIGSEAGGIKQGGIKQSSAITRRFPRVAGRKRPINIDERSVLILALVMISRGAPRLYMLSDPLSGKYIEKFFNILKCLWVICVTMNCARWKKIGKSNDISVS